MVYSSIPKILFKVSGSDRLGFGHIRRSISLAGEMAKLIPQDHISFFCDCTHQNVKEYLKPFSFYLNGKGNSLLLDYLKKSPADILIMDEIKENHKLSQVLKSLRPQMKIVALDYFNYDNRVVDIIINLFNHNEKVKDPKKRFSGRYYQGLQYAIIRESFFPLLKLKKLINPKIGKVLISFGGSDPKGNTHHSLRLLQKIDYQGKVDIIIGPFFKNIEKIFQSLRDKKFVCSLHKEVHDMERFIFQADIGFIGSGTTIMEFCSLGTPSVVIPQNDREKKFALSFEEQEAVYVLTNPQALSGIEGVKEIFHNQSLRKTMSTQAKKLVDGKGIERISRIILERVR